MSLFATRWNWTEDLSWVPEPVYNNGEASVCQNVSARRSNHIEAAITLDVQGLAGRNANTAE
jgi:hypothetical protein